MRRLESIAVLLICLVTVLMTMLYGGVHQPVLALFYFFAALLALLWAFDAWVKGQAEIGGSLLPLPLITLGVYAFIQSIPFGSSNDASGLYGISHPISADPFVTKLAAVQIVSLAVFFASMLIYIKGARRLSRLATFLTIFGFGYAFFAVLQSVLSPDAIYGIYKPQASPFGTFVNRNDFAALMVMLSSVPLGMLFSGTIQRDRRLLYWIAVALMATSVLLSQSRGGLIAFVTEVIVLAILTTRAKGTKKLLLTAGLSLLLISAAVGGAIFVGGETSIARFSSAETDFEVQNETPSRFHIWSVTGKMIAYSLPFGSGLGAFGEVYPKYDTSGGVQRVEQAHNDYLQLVSDAGIAGAVVGLLFLYLLAQQGRRSLASTNAFRHSIAAGALAGIIGILVHSLFDFVLHITAVSLTFLMLLALLVASGRSYDDDITDFDKPTRRRRRSANVTRLPLVSSQRAGE